MYIKKNILKQVPVVTGMSRALQFEVLHMNEAGTDLIHGGHGQNKIGAHTLHHVVIEFFFSFEDWNVFFFKFQEHFT